MRDFRTPETSKLETVRRLAVALMREHGLIESEWKFQWDKARTRFGQCRGGTNVISLSEPLCLINSMDEIRDTILHEIAHALVGVHNHHNEKWRHMAVAIGCNANRTHDAATVRGKYRLVCPNGHETFMHRKTRTAKSCSICNPNRYDERYRLEWEN